MLTNHDLLIYSMDVVRAMKDIGTSMFLKGMIPEHVLVFKEQTAAAVVPFVSEIFSKLQGVIRKRR